MARSSVVYVNLADSGAIDASSWISAAPPSTLQTYHVSERWKGRLGASEFLVIDLGSLVSLDTLALLGCQAIESGVQSNMASSAITRVRFSTEDTTAVDASVYDTGAAAGRINSAYGSLIIHLPAVIVARYIRIDLSQSSAEALLAGRLVVGLRDEFAINFNWGWSFGYADLSRIKKSVSGQTFVELDNKYRVLSVNFDWIEESQRYGFVNEIDRINGIGQDILFIIDHESANPDRDSVWGLMRDLTPPSNGRLGLFAKSYSIEERL